MSYILIAFHLIGIATLSKLTVALLKSKNPEKSNEGKYAPYLVLGAGCVAIWVFTIFNRSSPAFALAVLPVFALSSFVAVAIQSQRLFLMTLLGIATAHLVGLGKYETNDSMMNLGFALVIIVPLLLAQRKEWLYFQFGIGAYLTIVALFSSSSNHLDVTLAWTCLAIVSTVVAFFNAQNISRALLLSVLRKRLLTILSFIPLFAAAIALYRSEAGQQSALLLLLCLLLAAGVTAWSNWSKRLKLSSLCFFITAGFIGFRIATLN